MHYRCPKCNYEFDLYQSSHPHEGMKFGPLGCPVCRKAKEMTKFCPKCNAPGLIESSKKETNK